MSLLRVVGHKGSLPGQIAPPAYAGIQVTVLTLAWGHGSDLVSLAPDLGNALAMVGLLKKLVKM